MQVKILDLLIVPPFAVYRYLIVLPITHVTYYTTFPLRVIFHTLLGVISFFLELTGSFISLFKWLLLAVLVGLITGYALHSISRGLSSILGISSDVSFAEEVKPARSLADWRQQRKDKQLRRISVDDLQAERELASALGSSQSPGYEDVSSDF